MAVSSPEVQLPRVVLVASRTSNVGEMIAEPMNTTLISCIVAGLVGLVWGLAVVGANRFGFVRWNRYFTTNSIAKKVGIILSVALAWILIVGVLIFLAVVTLIRPGLSMIEVIAFGFPLIVTVVIAYLRGWMKSY